ncbi:MAG: ECF transporter S component [Halanaerobiaceae bacterium]
MNNIKENLRELKIKKITVSELAYIAMFIALVALTTFIRVPGLNTSYYNLGEFMIFTVALVFGAKAGLLAGALGSALVDLIVAPVWAPFTLIIKGFEGWLVGYVAEEGKIAKNVLALILGGHIMIVGYALTTWFLYDWPSVLPEIGGNYGQAGFGAILALPIARQINRYLGK